MTDWTAVSARAAFASHRLVGWIFWDPGAIERYAELGVPHDFTYYVASRGAPLLAAGHQAVAAAFYTINPDFVRVCVEEAMSHTTPAAIYEARNAAVAEGLRTYAPEICDGLAALAEPLWQAADELPASGRVLFAAHRQMPRPDDPLTSAWLAVNCIREFRGDTHFAITANEGLDGVQAGLLDDAWRNYGGWVPRSRGADEAAISSALARLGERALATGDRVNEAGIALRATIEERTDRLTEGAWRHLGEERTGTFVEIVERVGDRLVERVDLTAGPKWMPAARARSA